MRRRAALRARFESKQRRRVGGGDARAVAPSHFARAQERFGNMTRVYYKEAVGALTVFDVTREFCVVALVLGARC